MNKCDVRETLSGQYSLQAYSGESLNAIGAIHNIPSLFLSLTYIPLFFPFSENSKNLKELEKR
jgi:hypothetical protein